MFDMMLLFVMALAGGLVALMGLVIMIGRRIAEPKQELQQKIEKLEEEVERLKNNN